MSAFYQVVPSDGVGGAPGHGLFTAAKGLLRPRRSVVVSTASRSATASFFLKCSFVVFCVVSRLQRRFLLNVFTLKEGRSSGLVPGSFSHNALCDKNWQLSAHL